MQGKGLGLFPAPASLSVRRDPVAMTATPSLLNQALATAPKGGLIAWSLAVSFLGDCIVPRGGSVGMSTIGDVLGAYGIDNGVVRTAMSRLAAEGWVSRQRRGRNSFYSLTGLALNLSHAASTRIYATTPPRSSCGWRLYVLTGLAIPERKRLRDQLLRQGAGLLDAHVLILPETIAVHSLPDIPVLSLPPLAGDAACRLVRQCFQFDDLTRSYANFCRNHTPIAAALANRSQTLTGLEAVALRVLIIHRFRRIVLRDPGVPVECLGADWPGFAARKLVQEMRSHLDSAAEHWLDANAAPPVTTQPP